jgi:hypothetical protein
MARRLSVKLYRDEAIYVTRITATVERIVYVFVCDKKLQYPKGRSRIAYIGTTKNGVWRIASSAAQRAKTILRKRGIYTFWAQVVSCTPKPGLKSWLKLERALLLEFRERFGKVPLCNGTGHKMTETDEFECFARSRIQRVVEDLS